MYKLQKVNLPALAATSLRLKRNIFITSATIIIMVTQGASLPGNFKVLGFSFSELSIQNIYSMLTLSLIYFSIHYAWLSFDFYNSVKFKKTGIDQPSPGTGSTLVSNGNPQTNDPDQSNLYTWWCGYSEGINISKRKISDIEAVTGSEHNQLTEIKRILDEVEIEFDYIERALKEFNESLCVHMKSQLSRWLMLDVVSPSIMVVIAICLSVREILCN
jgi:hypothetical protein